MNVGNRDNHNAGKKNSQMIFRINSKRFSTKGKQ